MNDFTAEITAAHVLGALAPTAPAGAVIALEHDTGTVRVCPAADTTDWRSREIATIVATRSELEAVLDRDQRADIAALDALADDLTRHAAHLSAPAPEVAFAVAA